MGYFTYSTYKWGILWFITHLLTIDTNFPRDIQVAVFYPTAILANLDTDTSTLFKSVQPSWQKGGPEMRLSAVEAEPVQMKAKRQWCFLMIPWHLLKTCNKNRISKHLKKGSKQRKRNPSQLFKRSNCCLTHQHYKVYNCCLWYRNSTLHRRSWMHNSPCLSVWSARLRSQNAKGWAQP